MALKPADALIELRRRGITAHHAAPMPAAAGHPVLVVFLEASLGQGDQAKPCARPWPGVMRVQFAGTGKAIMYVTGGPAC